jgi:hypothetical protein
LSQHLKYFTEREIQSLFEALNSNQSIKTLDLSFNKLNQSTQTFILLLDLIKKNPFITKIDLTRNHFTIEQLEELAFTVLGNMTLQEVVFAGDEHRLADPMKIIELQTKINKNNYLLGVSGEPKANKAASSNSPSSTREFTHFKHANGSPKVALLQPPVLTEEKRRKLLEENKKANESLGGHLAKLDKPERVYEVLSTRRKFA